MKIVVAALVLFSMAVASFGQTLVPARLTAVSTNAWTNVSPSAATAQAALDWVDANWEPDLVTANWLFLDPAEDTAQSAFDWLDAWFASMGASNGFLRGTNILGAAFSNGQWTVDSQTAGLLPGTNISGAAYDPSNLTWNGLMPGTNISGAAYNPSNLTWELPPSGDIRSNYFMVFASNAVAVASNIHTLVTFEGTTADANGLFVSGDHSFRPKIAGTYLLHAAVVFTLGSTPVANRAILYLYKNGEVFAMVDRVGDSIATQDQVSFTELVRATTNDYFQVYRAWDGAPNATTNQARRFQGMLLSVD